jgi:hypothetical protein
VKRAGLIAAPLCMALALALPVLPLSGQDAAVSVDGDRNTSDEFPWPDFITVDPLPGQYRITTILENFEMLGLDVGKEAPESEAPPSEPEIELVCLAGDVERVDWLEEMLGQGNCTTDGVTGDDDAFRIAVQCNDPGAGSHTLLLTGSASEQGMDMQMAMTMHPAEGVKLNTDMRITVERVGDCE